MSESINLTNARAQVQASMPEVRFALNYLDLCRKLDDILRYSTVPVLRKQSVSEHSFHVAQLALVASADLNNGMVEHNQAKLLKLALMHDAEEGMIGDILYPIKNLTPKMKEAYAEAQTIKWNQFLDGAPEATLYYEISTHALPIGDTGVEAQVLNICDMLELVFYMLSEIRLGNRNSQITDIFNTGCEILPNMPGWGQLPTLHGVLLQLKNRKRQHVSH